MEALLPFYKRRSEGPTCSPSEAWPRSEEPDATAGIWVMTKGDRGGISENDSLLTSSLRLQSGYKRCRAFQRRRRAAFSGGRAANVEKKNGGREEEEERGTPCAEEPLFDNATRAERR